MPKTTTTALAIAAFILSIVGLTWTAAEKWGDLQARVRHLEATTQYLHGDIRVPEMSK